MAKPLLIGEINPYGSDPRYALYPQPKGSAGGRLCSLIMGLRIVEYIRDFDRANLCVRTWSLPSARARAEELLGVERPSLVLLGAKVCAAFRVGFVPFAVHQYRVHEPTPGRRFLELDAPGRLISVVVLPHPSGLSRTWNESDSIERARLALRRAGISVPAVGSEE